MNVDNVSNAINGDNMDMVVRWTMKTICSQYLTFIVCSLSDVDNGCFRGRGQADIEMREKIISYNLCFAVFVRIKNSQNPLKCVSF